MKYRIVTDRFAGFEVQARYWWSPFWIQCGFINTHSTLEGAAQYALEHSEGEHRWWRHPKTIRTVKYLGELNNRRDQ